jgi:hypothetical protein
VLSKKLSINLNSLSTPAGRPNNPVIVQRHSSLIRNKKITHTASFRNRWSVYFFKLKIWKTGKKFSVAHFQHALIILEIIEAPPIEESLKTKINGRY